MWSVQQLFSCLDVNGLSNFSYISRINRFNSFTVCTFSLQSRKQFGKLNENELNIWERKANLNILPVDVHVMFDTIGRIVICLNIILNVL